jgi:hypothetical protein
LNGVDLFVRPGADGAGWCGGGGGGVSVHRPKKNSDLPPKLQLASWCRFEDKLHSTWGRVCVRWLQTVVAVDLVATV